MSANEQQRDNFDKVWQRVMASNESVVEKQTGKSEEKMLEEFMEDEAFDAKCYDVLASRVTPWAKNIIKSIADDEKIHLKKLRTAYFILTGKTYQPQTVPVQFTCTADALRKRYIGESEGADAYLKASANSRKRDISLLYGKLACDEKRHAELINRLLENLMG